MTRIPLVTEGKQRNKSMSDEFTSDRDSYEERDDRERSSTEGHVLTLAEINSHSLENC